MKSLELLLSHHTVLFLQGPMGLFFFRLAEWMRRRGTKVLKVNFNGGDKLFFPGEDAYDYLGTQAEFFVWLKNFIRQNNIEAVVCFGDCRFYHRTASEVAKLLSVGFFAFEEGYLRPDYITLEPVGVNAYSKLKDSLENISEDNHNKNMVWLKPLPTGNSFWLMAACAMAYYLAANFWRARFSGYQHHRNISISKEIPVWALSWGRKRLYKLVDAYQQKKIIFNWNRKFFLIVLQVHNDSQVIFHSNYHDVRDFISDVVRSFAVDAPKDRYLVIKHHPLDRGYRNYASLIRNLSAKYHVEGRVRYVHDVHLPTFIKRSLGVVTINSTVGLQAIYHGKSCITLGRALYDISGLTHQKGLASFWSEPEPVDRQLYLQFRYHLIRHTQLNGAFYGDHPWMELSAPDVPVADQAISSY